ncbi:hypothetical protein [Tsuneonella sp. HG222]
MIDHLPRRTFIGLVGVAAGSAVSLTPASALTRRASLVGLDGRLSEAERTLLGRRARNPDVDLPVEIVRAWRAELRERVAGGRSIEAYTRWDLALVLEGLARDEGFSVEQQRVGESVFRTRIARAG